MAAAKRAVALSVGILKEGVLHLVVLDSLAGLVWSGLI